MMILGLIWPTIFLVALVFVVWATMFLMRMRHMRASPPQAGDMASGEASQRYFAPVEMPSNNLANLFEMPVLYFALVPLLMLTAQVTRAQVVLAWLFVIARAVHSLIHIARVAVPLRFLVYAFSCAMLLAMWIGFTVDVAAAARSYHAAMAGIAASTPQP